MITRLSRAARSAGVEALAVGATTSFGLIGESWRCRIDIDPTGIRTGALEDQGDVDFALSAPDSVWEGLVAAAPPAGAHSVVFLVRTGIAALSGSQLEYERHVHLVRALLDAARPQAVVAGPGRPLSSVGSYVRVTTSLGTSDIHVERVGSGPQLLALATAGSSIAQWHGIVTHSDLTDRFELITADLPWHGASSPAWDAPIGSYRLTPESYTEQIVAIADALELERPTLVGVSMGGAAVVHAVATHPNRFAGAVACQAGPSVQSRANEHLRGTRVNTATFIPEWTQGLMNPASPRVFRDRVWWGYSSGGHGLYAADIESYLSWDLESVEHLLSTDSPHIAVLSGEFDTSVPSARSRELADRIPNASFRSMPELGHFPHAEDPEVFARYLEDALARVLDRGLMNS